MNETKTYTGNKKEIEKIAHSGRCPACNHLNTFSPNDDGYTCDICKCNLKEKEA